MLAVLIVGERLAVLGWFGFALILGAVLDAIAESPLVRRAAYRNVRRPVLPRFPYQIWLVVDENSRAIHVLACTHARRDPQRLRRDWIPTLVLDVRTPIWHRNDIVVALLLGSISHCLDGDSGQQHQIWDVGGVVPRGLALA